MNGVDMATITLKESRKKTKDIPKELIYEMDEGKPIYYRGYQEYLKGNKQPEELIGSSYLQVHIITLLIEFLIKSLPAKYRVYTNEVGLQFKKKSWRAADLVIYEKSSLKNLPIENKYLNIPPKIVIEVDTKASFENFPTPMDYCFDKTEKLLDFGVEKVIWIFTYSRKVMLAEPRQKWITYGWAEDIEIVDDISVNIEKLVKEG